jgi:DNA-directed RNA polymerase I subunit RPA1
VISKKLSNVVFGYYTPDEIRGLSVKEIKSPKAFDALNNAIKGGLYDPALGVQPHDRGSRCVTCGQESFNCTGHLGHIELLLPVYNPFLVNKLLSLLRSKCFFCHRLRITKERKKQYRMMFKMLRLGLLTEMKEFESLIH